MLIMSKIYQKFVFGHDIDIITHYSSGFIQQKFVKNNFIHAKLIKSWITWVELGFFSVHLNNIFIHLIQTIREPTPFNSQPRDSSTPFNNIFCST